MKYCSIDVETTGLDANNCDLLEVGAIVDDLDHPLSPDPPSFHCYVVKDFYRGDPYALSMHPVIFRRIANREPGYNYYNEIDVAGNLWAFLDFHFGKNKVNVAGKNFDGLDRLFLMKLPNSGLLNFHKRVIDPAMLYWNWKEDQFLPSSEECLKRAGFDTKVKHTALEDAMMVIRLIREKTVIAQWK